MYKFIYIFVSCFSGVLSVLQEQCHQSKILLLTFILVYVFLQSSFHMCGMCQFHSCYKFHITLMLNMVDLKTYIGID